MGFAGQVFAARVAVGLAVPSQQSLNKAGGLIASAVGGIYGKMRAKKIEAAKANLSATTSALATQGKVIKSFQERSAKELEGSSARTIKKIRGLATSGSMAMETGGAIAKLKSKMSKVAPGQFNALFKGIKMTGKAAMTESQQMAKMMSNFTKMSQKERVAVTDYMKDRVDMQRRNVQAMAAEVKAGKSKMADLQRETKLYKEYKQEQKEMAILSRDHAKLKAALAKEEDKLSKEEKELIALYKKHEKELKKVNVETVKQTQNIKQFTGQVVTSFKRGFTDALRESTAALTAFYYKLQQNTQELIEFERELLNANSVFNVTRDELFATGEQVTQFGQQFGLEMQNGAAGLYQLASAGLTAEQAMKILPETLKLSMAVQGDHNTISKLTTQTLFGFGMEMDRAAEVTDKFAFAIQKSLIEYEDLSSAVKFALPFFTATGQSIDQLLGALQVLTNRALEAGIAGRGLRQALSEFAEGADDNTTAFAKMGINIKDATGAMLPLTEIAAKFAATIGPEVTHNTELLTALIQDLNVRGATAFIHLVQASDEFTQAVEDTKNAGGELDRMVNIQNESLSAQIQILKNNAAAIFFMRDATYEGTEYLNAFHEALVRGVQTLKDLIVVETEAGYVLTQFGNNIQQIAIRGIQLMVDLLGTAIKILRKFSDEGRFGISILAMYAVPLKAIAVILTKMPADLLKLLVAYHVLNKVLGLGVVLQQKDVILKGIRLALSQSYYSSMLKETTVENMSTVALIRHNISLAWANWLRKGNTISTWQGIKAKLADVWATISQTIADAANTVGKYLLYAAMILFFPLTLLLIGVKKLYVLWTNAETTAEFFQTIGTWLLIAAKWAFVGVMLIISPLLGIITLGYMMYTGALSGAAVVTWLLQAAMWALTAVPIVLLLVAIGLAIVAVVYGLYQINQQFNVIGGILKALSATWKWFADGIKAVWEDVIFPVVYRLGLEMGALVGIFIWLGQTIMEKLAGPWAYVKEKLQPVVDLVMAMLDGFVQMKDLVYDLGQKAFEGMIYYLKKAFEWVQKLIKKVKDTIALAKKLDVREGAKKAKKKVVGAVKSTLGKLNPFATGGYVTPMQGGGNVGRNPYLVGERGPELMIPNMAGKIISNKDLNSRRGLDILERLRGRAKGRRGAKTMRVENLEVGKLTSSNSSIGVNAFAGNAQKKVSAVQKAMKAWM